MPDQGYDSNIVDYGCSTEDGRGKDYILTYRQGDEVNSYNPRSTSERWEKFTNYMDPNGKSDSVCMCVYMCVCVLETHIPTHMNMCWGLYYYCFQV